MRIFFLTKKESTLVDSISLIICHFYDENRWRLQFDDSVAFRNWSESAQCNTDPTKSKTKPFSDNKMFVIVLKRKRRKKRKRKYHYRFWPAAMKRRLRSILRVNG